MASVIIAYILWLPLGWLGLHRFYTGHTITGLIWMFSLGLVGIGWFVDLFMVPGLVDAANQRKRNQSGFGGVVKQHVAEHAAEHVATNLISSFMENK